jgi:hypothetical protein
VIFEVLLDRVGVALKRALSLAVGVLVILGFLVLMGGAVLAESKESSEKEHADEISVLV